MLWLFELRICYELPKIRVSDEKNLMETAAANYNFDLEKESRLETTDDQSLKISSIRENAEAIERARASIFALSPQQFELLVKHAMEVIFHERL